MALSLYYQNVRGLRLKLRELRLNLANFDGDLVCMTESWLNDGIFDSELTIGDSNYNIFRRDRNYDVSETTMGGGCIIFCKSYISCQRMYEFETNLDKLEDLWIKINVVNGPPLYVCVMYISSKDDSHLYQNHLEKVRNNINSFESDARIIIMGDFNRPCINWVQNSSMQIEPFYEGENSTVNDDLC